MAPACHELPKLGRLDPQRSPPRQRQIASVRQRCHDYALVGHNPVPQRILERGDRGTMQVEQGDLVLIRIRRDAFERLFDAREKPVAETGLAMVKPVAGFLEILRSEAAETNGPRQRGGWGSRRRAFRSARTSCHGRATLASSSNVSSRRRSSASTSGGTGVSSASGRVGTGWSLLTTILILRSGHKVGKHLERLSAYRVRT